MSKRKNPGSRRLSRRSVLAGAAGALAAPSLVRAAAAPRPDRPNLLYIFTDQQSATMLSCAGNGNLKTAAMDSLAAAGARFERAYATNPVCVPSRVGMITGHMPGEFGINHNGQIRNTIPAAIQRDSMGSLFQRAGYDCAYGGKTHLPKELSPENGGFRVIARDQRESLAQACTEFIRTKPDKPFLLVASFINPHDICYMAIDAYARKASRAPLGDLLKQAGSPPDKAFVEKHCPPLPDNYAIPADEPEAVKDFLAARPFKKYVRETWSDDQWQVHRWAYCRLTEIVDREISQVLQALRESRQEENTVVIFSSDHGDHDSARKMEHKTVPYEEAARIPLLVSWKGHTRPGLVDQTHLVSNGLDLIPTLCDYAGIEVPPAMQGRSVRALAEGRAAESWRDQLVVECEIGRAMLTDRYKYIVYRDGADREQLFYLSKDPHEKTNLAKDAGHRDVLNDHRRRLVEWVRRQKDPVAGAYVVPPTA